MPVIINLSSNAEGTLKSFLNSYFGKDSKLDNDVIEWINFYNKPLEAIDLMTAVIDNSDKYDIQILVSMDAGLFLEVTYNNINDIVKFMLFRFYKEKDEEIA